MYSLLERSAHLRFERLLVLAREFAGCLQRTFLWRAVLFVMPVTVVVNFQSKPGRCDDLVDFLSGVQDGAIAAGCHSIAVHRVQDTDDGVVEIEYWDSREAHEKFVGAAVEAGAFAPFDDLLAAPFAIQYLDPAKKTDA